MNEFLRLPVVYDDFNSPDDESNNVRWAWGRSEYLRWALEDGELDPGSIIVVFYDPAEQFSEGFATLGRVLEASPETSKAFDGKPVVWIRYERLDSLP